MSGLQSASRSGPVGSIDGQQAVLFLVRIKELMEDPALLAID